MATTLKYLNKLAGKRVLVLGGTSGIGFCVAEAALEHGAHVTVSSSNPDRVAAAVERLKRAYPESSTATADVGVGVGGGGSVVGHVCDLAQTDRLEENLEGLLKVAAAAGGESDGDGESGGKINHVVLTAGGVPHMPPIRDITADDVHSAGAIRFITPFLLAKVLHTYMDLDPANSFTLTGGASAHKPWPGFTVGAAYVAALEGIMRGLAVDMKPLRVNIVEPGAVLTELTVKMAGSQVDQLMETAKARSTTGTVAEPEDVAETYIGVMKDKFVTGSILETNGGMLVA